jgi:hypothetical protein
MTTLTTKQLRALTGYTPVALARRCQQLGIGSTTRGRKRTMGIGDACRLALLARLTNVHLMPPNHAASIASTVTDDDWAGVVEFEAEGRWLLIRTHDGEWLTAIGTTDEAFSFQPELETRDVLIVNLVTIARDVMLQVAMADNGRGGHG